MCILRTELQSKQRVECMLQPSRKRCASGAAHARLVPSRRSPLEDESGTIAVVSMRTDGHDIALDGDRRSEVYVGVVCETSTTSTTSDCSVRPDN